MGIKEAAIILDNQYNTYYAGQTVNGRIEYVFDSPKKVRGISVKLKGEGNTFWTESETEQSSDGKSRDVETAHTGNEEYFQINYYLLGSKTGSEIEIPPGKQVYEFTCALPQTLPSSFEGKFGFVRYTVTVTLDRPWKFDQDTKMAFTVINPLDLNLNPSYKQPIRMQFEKTFCCFCCVSPPLSVDVQAPVSGYCPGQAIPVQIDVENKSNVQLHLVKVLLRKVVTFRATSPKTAIKKTKDVVVEVSEGPAPAGSERHWTLKLDIPPIPPSNLVNCSLIDLDYDLKVECVVSGIHMNLSDKKYVTIGTIPLMSGAGQPPPSPGPAMLPMSPGQPSPAMLPISPGQPNPAVLPVSPGQPHPADPNIAGGGWAVSPNAPSAPPYQALYPTLSAPVYQQSTYSAHVLQRGDKEHTHVAGADTFAPHYPTYAAVTPPTLPPLPQ